MCTILFKTLLLCQNISSIPPHFNNSIAILVDSPNIDLHNLSMSVRSVVFINHVPTCTNLSKLQIDTIPTCAYKLPKFPGVVPEVHFNKISVLFFLLLILLLIYILSCMHMQITKVSI